MKYVIGSVDEIPSGGRKIVQVGRRSIGIFNVDGEFFALRNRCPHQGGPLCQGKLWGVLAAGAPGEFKFEPRREMITCPWHGWEFHLRTGQSWCDPDTSKVRSYRVGLATGSELRASTEGALLADRSTAPYVAETFEVKVEDRYLVLDLSP